MREARASFADLIGSVQHTGEPVVIERRGKPVVAMVPAAEVGAVPPDGGRVDPSLLSVTEGAPTVRGILERTSRYPRAAHTSALSGREMREIAGEERWTRKR